MCAKERSWELKMKIWTIIKMVEAAARNKKVRGCLFGIVLTPLLIIILFISIIFYVISSPLEIFLQDGKDTRGIQAFKEGLTFDREEEGDTAGNYTEINIQNGETQVVYFNQKDAPWGNMLYGTLKNIGVSGCGPTSMAMVVSSLSSTKISPIVAADWSKQNGYLVEGYENNIPYAMSSHALIPAMAEEYGLSSIGIGKSTKTAERIYEELGKGKLIVAIMGPGHFTSGGHFIVLYGVKNGKILVADSASRERTMKEWDIDIIIRESKGSAGAGGPFWAISQK